MVRALGFLFVLIAAILAGGPARAADNNPADFFRGKTISYIVSAEPGGGYDTYGRLIARHMQKYLPGSRIVVRNVTGAGNIIGANTIFVARPDGLTIGTFNSGLIYGQLLELPGIRFRLTEMSWIGKAAEEGRTLVLATRSGFDDVRDLMMAQETVRLASASLGTANHMELLILREALGLNVRLIPGISGSDTELSMLRGEVAGALNAASSNDVFVRQGNGKYVLAITGRTTTMAGVPQARDLVRDPKHLNLLGLMETVAELGRLTVGPPGIPSERLEVMRDAYIAATRDAELLEQAQTLRIPIQPARGEVVAEKIRAVLGQPPAVVTELRRVVSATQ
jgi:tripartite-type tricarboxylate transporter receptor subunit TctC